jgi:hypothetical protein
MIGVVLPQDARKTDADHGGRRRDAAGRGSG